MAAPQDIVPDPVKQELDDHIDIVDHQGRRIRSLIAVRSWLPDVPSSRGDARIGVTAAGHVYVALAQTLCWSEDGGRSWKSRSLPERSWGFGILGGDVMVLVTGYSSYTRVKGEAFRHCAVIRSTDFGRTWSKPILLNIAPYDRCGAGWSQFYQLPDGTALLTLRMQYGTGSLNLENQTPLPDDRYGRFDHIYRSRDSGKTWGERTLIVPHASDSSVLRLKSGKLMAAVRLQRSGRLLRGDDVARLKEIGAWANDTADLDHNFFLDSEDGGHTWKNSRLAPTTPDFKRLAPSELVQLPDGRLIWIYSQESGAVPGIYARISRDEGRTWSAERYLLRRLRHKDEGTYPTTAVLQEPKGLAMSAMVSSTWRGGTILTITSKNGSNRPMAIRWTPLSEGE